MANALSQTVQETDHAPVTSPDDSPADKSLRLNEAGLDLIRERLRAANRDNPEFAPQCDRLLAAIREALDGLLLHFPDEIERVLARGEWALDGIDLRTLRDAADLYLEIVVRTDELEFALLQQISCAVFADIQSRHIGSFLLQFTGLPLPLWHHALGYVASTGRDVGTIGVPLLVRE